MQARRVVGWNVRRIRVSRALTIEALAGEAEIDPSYVARLERGVVNPTIGVLEKLAVALRTPLIELFVEPPPGARPPRPLRSGRRSSRLKSSTREGSANS